MLLVDWNSAIRKARHNAILKKRLSEARADLFWLVLDGDNYAERESSIGYLQDQLTDIAIEYETENATEQSEQLDKLLKFSMFHSDWHEKEEWCMEVNEFFNNEIEFFSNKIDKYDRLLGTEPTKTGPEQLHIIF